MRSTRSRSSRSGLVTLLVATALIFLATAACGESDKAPASNGPAASPEGWRTT
jgi:hypothetical protein